MERWMEAALSIPGGNFHSKMREYICRSASISIYVVDLLIEYKKKVYRGLFFFLVLAGLVDGFPDKCSAGNE